MARKKIIGFLDSGVGGISVLACTKCFIPDAEYIYYADTDNVPYGTKTREQIVSYVDKALSTLISLGADAIVIACNTATSMAVEIMREKYPLPIIGLEPALKPAAIRHPDGKILVCATSVTIAGERLHTLIESTGARPALYALPELVTFAEGGIFDKAKVCAYLEKTIAGCADYDAVVLGCTHFTYFREAFEEAFPNAEIIDGNLGAARRLAYMLDIPFADRASAVPSETTYLHSGREVNDPAELHRFATYEAQMIKYYGTNR